METKLRWGIIGTGRIAGMFAEAVTHSKLGVLAAVGSRSQGSADEFADRFDIPNRHPSYDALIADPTVDAIYISTPHPMHAEWAVKCAAGGKHILCEKPVTMNAADAEKVIEEVKRHDVFFMEAFMYRCNPQTARLIELIKDGAIGDLRIIRASFGFHAPYNLEGRLLNNALGGGGILDVGCYPISMSRLLAGVATGKPFAEPIEITGSGHVGEQSKVDEYALATLKFEGNIVAQLSTAIQCVLDNKVHLFGTDGQLIVETPWFGTGFEGGESTIQVLPKEGDAYTVTVRSDEWLYGIEADVVARNIDQRQAAWPAMTWDDTIGNMRALDQWRKAVGVSYEEDSR